MAKKSLNSLPTRQKVSNRLLHSYVFAEVTSFLVLPELLELRTVSTGLRSLVDSDDLWERRFLADANPLTKAIFFTWVEHVSKATECGLNLLKKKPTFDPDDFLEQSHRSRWVFMPMFPANVFINTATLAIVRDGMVQRLRAELHRGHLSVVFTASNWPNYLPLLTSEKSVVEKEQEESSVVGGKTTSGGRSMRASLQAKQLSESVFLKLSQANKDISVPLASSIGFDKIRQILFGRRVMVECLAAARVLRDAAGLAAAPPPSKNLLNLKNQTKKGKNMPSKEKKKVNKGSQSVPKNLQDLFNDRNLMDTAEPFFKDWKSVYRFFLEPFPLDHPMRNGLRWFQRKKRDGDSPDGVGEIWKNLKDFYNKKPKVALSRATRKMLTPEERKMYQKMFMTASLTPGIHRTLADCHVTLLLRSRGRRIESDWRVCLLWLSGVNLPDWTPYLTPLVERGAHQPTLIFPPALSSADKNSQVNFKWIWVIPVALIGTLGLNAFHDLSGLLKYSPPLLATATLAAIRSRSLPISRQCTNAEGSRFQFTLSETLRHPLQSLQRALQIARELFVPVRLDSGFSPFASISLWKRVRWSAILAFERWKHNLLRLQVHGVVFVITSVVISLAFSFVSIFFQVNDYRKILLLVSDAALSLYLTAEYRDKTAQFTSNLFQMIRRDYPPTEEDMKSFKRSKRNWYCPCFACVTDQRAPPPVLQLLRQLNDFEKSFLPILSFSILLFLRIQAVESEPSIWYDMMDPLLLWVGSTTLACTASAIVNGMYWWGALR